MTSDILKPNSSPLIIAGPCSAESRSQVLETGRLLAASGIKIFRAGVWKPRTRPGGFEGHGAEALKWLKEVRETFGMLTATEVGTAAHAEQAIEEGVDILWIGARTTASPFAVQEIADALRGTDYPILVKNPVCADLELWTGAIERLQNAGLSRIGMIHRGFKTYGDPIFRNSPHWEIAEAMRTRFPGMTMLCDPSHMGGSRELIAPISTRALRTGYHGLIIESHCNPAQALTDGAQQITPEALSSMLLTITAN